MKKFILGIATIGLMTFGLGGIIASQVQDPLVSYAEGDFVEVSYSVKDEEYSIVLISETECKKVSDEDETLGTYVINTSELVATFDDEELSFIIGVDNVLFLVAEPIQETIKNAWEYVLEILEKPLVIGGVSTSIGAIVLFALAKLFTSLNKRKIVALGNQVKELSKKIADNASKQKLVELAQNIEELKEVVKVVIDGTKNVNIREKANALLLEMKPLLEQVKEVIEKEEPVVEEKQINNGIQI